MPPAGFRGKITLLETVKGLRSRGYRLPARSAAHNHSLCIEEKQESLCFLPFLAKVD